MSSIAKGVLNAALRVQCVHPPISHRQHPASPLIHLLSKWTSLQQLVLTRPNSSSRQTSLFRSVEFQNAVPHWEAIPTCASRFPLPIVRHVCPCDLGHVLAATAQAHEHTRDVHARRHQAHHAPSRKPGCILPAYAGPSLLSSRPALDICWGRWLLLRRLCASRLWTFRWQVRTCLLWT
jgi:hypothetical protein